MISKIAAPAIYHLPGEKIPRHASRRHLEVTADSIKPRSAALSKLKNLPDEKIALRRDALSCYDLALIIDGQKELSRNRDEGGIFAFLAYCEINQAERKILDEGKNLSCAREEMAFIEEFLSDEHPAGEAKWRDLARAKQSFLKCRHGMDPEIDSHVRKLAGARWDHA
ncbi:hypothetical protein EF919_38660 [Streptomyces sp. WAC02707]|uniref:hypothetical protein n=1 Tax=Streptomyces sp. WAC02707 TaxID=2487417 RepID=UPI000F7B4109|nr:hypothetical protein [Streptomyces sp. WAC02707]RSS84581.1 hypothetical protein EF919_38660 [Streptomyces sp. WAC02707]